MSRIWITPVLVVALALLACKGKGRGSKPTTTATGTVTAEPIALPDLDAVPVSAAGKKAIEQVARANGFGGTAVGYAGTPTPPIASLRALVTEPKAMDAFLYILRHGTNAGKLLALVGLYRVDRPTFSREVTALRGSKAQVPVLWNGCAPGGDPTAMSEIIEKPGAIRMSDSDDSLAEWSRRNPGAKLELDIVGGGYAASFLPPTQKPAPAPSASTH